jgi:hypothetical protein
MLSTDFTGTEATRPEKFACIVPIVSCEAYQKSTLFTKSLVRPARSYPLRNSCPLTVSTSNLTSAIASGSRNIQNMLRVCSGPIGLEVPINLHEGRVQLRSHLVHMQPSTAK